jgi:hypothetical protein
MKRSTLYLLLTLIGSIITWFFNAQYLMQGGGLDPAAFFRAAMLTPLTTAITLDVYWSAIVFSIWVLTDAKENAVPFRWLFIFICFGTGLAVALPAYLGIREKQKEKARSGTNMAGMTTPV